MPKHHFRQFFPKLLFAICTAAQLSAIKETRAQRVKGKWALEKSPTPFSDSSAVCPQYLESYLLTGVPICSAEDTIAQRYLEGSWVRLPSQCHPGSHDELAMYAYPYQQECDNAEFMCGSGTSSCENKVLHLAQWAWSPSFCTLLPFDAIFLSQNMAGKRVLFLGDSTMRQQFWAFGLMMKAKGLIDVDVFRAMQWTTSHNATFAVEGIQFLTGNPMDEPGQFDPSLEKATWLTMMDAFDVLVFNTGFHHHRRDPEFRYYQEMVNTVLSAIHQRKKPDQKIFFQSSVTPHVDCESASRPLRSYFLRDGQFSWALPILNEWRWAETAHRLHMTNFVVLNASISHLRADAHVGWKTRAIGQNVTDCLHQCSPGVPDYYNWVVAHALMVIS